MFLVLPFLLILHECSGLAVPIDTVSKNVESIISKGQEVAKA